LRATLKHIAEIAGVSHTTVSRVLNNSEKVSPETKKHILKIANELNYSSNINAKSLVTKRSGNIGLFFSSTSQRTSPGFFYETLKGVNSITDGCYNLIVREVGLETEFYTIEADRLDGILFVSQSESDDSFIQDVLSKGIPLVVLNREVKDGIATNVIPLESEGIRMAVDFLVENGHSDIAVIQGTDGYKSSQNRLSGYLQSMHNNNLLVKAEYMVRGQYTVDSGVTAMKVLLSLPSPPTAVVAFNDDMAVGAIRAVVESGKSVPWDISLIGFDGNVECDYVVPTLTTVDKCSLEVSIRGAEKLLNQIAKKEYVREKIYVNTKLVVKNSVRSLNNTRLFVAQKSESSV